MQQHSQLHLIMRDISLLPQDILPGDDQYHFSARASDLLQKWTATLLPDVKLRSWVIDKTGKMLQNIEWYDDGEHYRWLSDAWVESLTVHKADRIQTFWISFFVNITVCVQISPCK